MDQIVCIVRKNNSYAFIQTRQMYLKFPQFPVQFDLTTDVQNMIDDIAFPLLRNVLGVDVSLKGIISVKSCILPLDHKRLIAFYVLVDIADLILPHQTDGSDYIWHSLKTLRKKLDQQLVSFQDFELIRAVEKGEFFTNYSTVDFIEANIIWTEDEIVKKLTDAQNKLRLSAKYDEKAFDLLKLTYMAFTFPEQAMTQDQFTKFLTTINIPDASTNSHRYFRAFDLHKANKLSFLDFILGCAAMEMQTTHGNEPGEQRCRYIFRFYCEKYDFNMAFGEMITMIDDIIALRMQNESKQAKEAYRANLAGHFNDAFTMTVFLQKVGSLQLRGTSVLFRSRSSILERSKEALNLQQPDSKNFIGTAPETKSEQSASGNGYEKANNKTERMDVVHEEAHAEEDKKAYEISSHVLQLGSTENVEEIIRNMPDVISASSTTSKSANTYFSDEEFCAKQLLRALDFFHKPYIVNGQEKKAFDWTLVDISHVGECLLELCSHARKIFCTEPRLLELDDPIYILGTTPF